jgi:hypothetical protein
MEEPQYPQEIGIGSVKDYQEKRARRKRPPGTRVTAGLSTAAGRTFAVSRN